jgi:ATP-dependent RNA helicase RhlB
MTHHQPLTDTVFESFDLHPSLLAGLNEAGFIRCTPIQAMTLPFALAGRDIAGQAQTGTGKTAAFLVAVLNRLLTRPAMTERKVGDPRAVILAPTRELAFRSRRISATSAGTPGFDLRADLRRRGLRQAARDAGRPASIS